MKAKPKMAASARGGEGQVMFSLDKALQSSRQNLLDSDQYCDFYINSAQKAIEEVRRKSAALNSSRAFNSIAERYGSLNSLENIAENNSFDNKLQTPVVDTSREHAKKMNRIRMEPLFGKMKR